MLFASRDEKCTNDGTVSGSMQVVKEVVATSLVVVFLLVLPIL